MPCYFPLQASFSILSSGKKDISFSRSSGSLFRQGIKPLGDNNLSLPCGRCMGCRLERSRQWAVRIMHEASLYTDNCFVTLTFDDDHLASECPNGSLSRSHPQLFLKRLRQRFSDRRIRTFYCGEYGDMFARPHYHLCLFNLDFPDKLALPSSSSFPYFSSSILSSLWTFGFHVISDLTFDSAAYVARYCTKKITGPEADLHYCGRLPEFAQASLKPGLGTGWLKKFGFSDVFSRDELVVNGIKCKPPRFYDKFLESVDPDLFSLHRSRRVSRAFLRADDNTFERLADKRKCLEARIKPLIRRYEHES